MFIEYRNEIVADMVPSRNFEVQPPASPHDQFTPPLRTFHFNGWETRPTPASQEPLTNLRKDDWDSDLRPFEGASTVRPARSSTCASWDLVFETRVQLPLLRTCEAFAARRCSARSSRSGMRHLFTKSGLGTDRRQCKRMRTGRSVVRRGFIVPGQFQQPTNCKDSCT